MPAPGWRRVFRLDVGRRHVEHDVDQEIAFHLEMKARKLVAAGLDPVSARQTALDRFGDLAGVRDECLEIDHRRQRSMRWSDIVAGFRQDAHYAMRSLRKQPAFTLMVLLMLGVGIGANTATFTVIDALLLRPLPVPHPEQLVSIGNPAKVNSGWHGSPMIDYVSYPVYADVRDHTHVFSGLYATGQGNAPDIAVGSASADIERPRTRLVTENYFGVLEVPAAVGRTFTSADAHGTMSDPVAVIGYGYWQRRFGGEASAIGTKVWINGTPFTIIGVAPERFTGDVVGEATDIWLPMSMMPAVVGRGNWLGDRTWSWLQMMGRLAPGVTLAEARRAVTAVETRSLLDNLVGTSLASFEEDLATTPVRVQSGALGFSSARKLYASALGVLMASVVLVVLVVCANVANLTLTRGASRARELTLRLSLGASRLRLVQQLLIESLIIVLVAGALGLVLSFWGSHLLLAVARPGKSPIPLDVMPNGRTLAFTAGVALLCALLFGLVPALRVTRVDVATALRAQGRSVVGGRGRAGRFLTGRTLVAAQIALSALLLIGTTLFLRSTRQLLTSSLGVDRDRIVQVEVSAGHSGYSGSRTIALMRDLERRAAAIPGVVSVSFAENGLFDGGFSTMHVSLPGFVAHADSELSVNSDDVGPRYFRTIGAPLLRGRDIDARDDGRASRVAVINASMAKYYFPNADPIGRTISAESTLVTIVGVVGDVEEADVRAAPGRWMYLPIAQDDSAPLAVHLTVRVASDPSRFVAPLRNAVRSADRNLKFNVTPLDALVRDSVAQDLLVSRVTTFFGILALLLAGIGLYGVTAYTTWQRTGELGLRVALGAQPRDVAALILREAVTLAVIGLAVGVPAGLALAALVRGQLFGVAPVDPTSLGVAVIVLVVTALAASYLPARRAARIDPIEALRAE